LRNKYRFFKDLSHPIIRVIQRAEISKDPYPEKQASWILITFQKLIRATKEDPGTGCVHHVGHSSFLPASQKFLKSDNSLKKSDKNSVLIKGIIAYSEIETDRDSILGGLTLIKQVSVLKFEKGLKTLHF
jgi:hypothetical protein